MRLLGPDIAVQENNNKYKEEKECSTNPFFEDRKKESKLWILALSVIRL